MYMSSFCHRISQLPASKSLCLKDETSGSLIARAQVFYQPSWFSGKKYKYCV